MSVFINKDDTDFLNSNEWWDFQDWLHRRREYKDIPWNYEFSSASDVSDPCLIVYAFMLNSFSKNIKLDEIIFSGSNRGINCFIYPPASKKTTLMSFTGDTILPWQLPYKAEYDREEGMLIYRNDPFPGENLNMIGNFMPIPKGNKKLGIKSLSDIKGKNSSCKSMHKGTKCQWAIFDYFDLYLQYIATYAPFQNRKAQGLYRVPLIDDNGIINKNLKMAITSPELYPYFGLFESLDDFIKKNYLEGLFYADGNHKTLIPFHQSSFVKYLKFTETFALVRGKRIVSDIVSGRLSLT